jgi:hypothetical protein
MRSILLAALLVLVAGAAVAQDWGKIATISSTLGVSGSRVCIGEASRGDIGCPAYAPYVNSVGNVGLGTPLPSTALEVSGTISATHFVGDGSGLTGIGGGDRIVSGTTSMVANTASNIISITNGGTNTGYFNSNGMLTVPGISATANLTSVTTLYASGNVGIGTTAPSVALEVSGTISSTNILRGMPRGGTFNYNTGIGISNTAGGIRWQDGSSNSNTPDGDGTSGLLLYLDPLFNTADGNKYSLQMATAGQDGRLFWREQLNGTWGGWQQFASTNTGISGDRITSGTTSMVAQTASNIISITNGGNTFGYFNSNGVLTVPGISATANLTSVTSLSASGLATFSKGMLFNQGGIATYNLMYLGSNTSGPVDASMGFFAAGLGSANATDGPYFLARGNSFTDIGNQRGNLYFSAGTVGSPSANEGGIHFLIGAGDAMAINNSGNVGIGTSGISAKLEVNGAISATNVYVTATTGTVSATYGYFTYISATNGLSGGSGDRIVSGTTSMVAQTASNIISITNGGTTFGYFNSNGVLTAPGISATANLTSVTSLYASGKIGIGSSTIGAQLLKITGDASVNSMFEISDTAVGGRDWILSPGAGTGDRSELNIFDVTSATNRMSFASTGNVGINNVSPHAKLDVIGTISASSAIQVGSNALTCGTGISGTMRYSAISSTMEYCNGSAWTSMGPSSTSPVAFSVSLGNVNQSVLTKTFTKIPFNIKAFDTNNNFDATTNYRFTPTVPGYYLFYLNVFCGDSTTFCAASIFKNGAPATQSNIEGNGASAFSESSKVLYMNGSTDYVEAYGYNDNGTLISGNPVYTYFNGIILGPQAPGGGGSTPAGSTNDVQFNSGSALGADTGNFTYASSVLKAPTVSATSVYAANVSATNIKGTLTTAAQGNITSLGTLTGLTMGGNIALGGNSITGGGTATFTTLAGTLSTATQSNITSLGTLTALTMGGTITMGGNNITGGGAANFTSLGGTLTTAAQGNITSLGTLSGLTMNGDINMNTHSITNAGQLAASSAAGIVVYGNTTNATGGNGVYGANSGTGYLCYMGSVSYSLSCAGPTSGVSDRRLKKDITPLDPSMGLAAIMQLQPVRYRWRDERMNKKGRKEIGFIAQNVESVLPELVGEVTQASDTRVPLPGHKSKALEYDRLIAPAILAIQQLKADNDNLRADFEAYKRAHP